MNIQEDSLQAICLKDSPCLDGSVVTLPTEQAKEEETFFDLDESLNHWQDCLHPLIEECFEPLENIPIPAHPSPSVICRKTLTYQSAQPSAFIALLIENTNRNPDAIHKFIALHSPKHLNLFLTSILIDKFKKLKKTKEQMIKYCMRKAFKFIMEMPSSHFLYQNTNLFENQNFRCNKIKNKFIKKISAEKSMNTAYLKHIFQRKGFKRDYQEFLEKFEEIVREDNEKKAEYLANLIIEHSNDFEKFAGLRRLPWTNCLLTKVKHLAKELVHFATPEYN